MPPDQAPPPPPPPVPTAPPTELDARRELAREFRIECLLDNASTPIAYVARDGEDRALTLKVVPLDRINGPPDRALAAIEAAGRLDHPHIVPVLNTGATAHFLWYAARYVEGRTLANIVATLGPLDLATCLRIFTQVASALDYAHRRGVTHGALTAECIVVDANEWALVGDFGTAGLVDSRPSGGPAADREAADQRALAIIVRRCLAGPDGGNDPSLPLHVSQALRRAQSVRAADRFPSVLDFVAALEGGATRPNAGPAWFSSKPRQGPGSPVVIADADADPAAPRKGRRATLATGLAIVLAAGAAWLGRSSVPDTLPSGVSANGPATSPPPTASPTAPRSGPSIIDADPDRRVPPQTAAALTTPEIRSVPARPAPSAPPPAAPRPAAPRRPPARTPAAPAPPAVTRRMEPALLSINAIPWGSVYLDGRPVGNTPQIDLAVPPGSHRLHVERDGFRPYDRVIELAPGQRLRITDIALVER